MICGAEHSSSKCPELYSPLKNGFYSGSTDRHSHNDEETKNGFIKTKITSHYSQLNTQNVVLRV